MKKIKLNIEQLKVESFRTSKSNKQTGTVAGNGTYTAPPNCEQTEAEMCEPSDYATNCDATCGHTYCNENSCELSCNGTCGGYTCDYPCK
ncbi:MAG: pinensin family lanthipeptide [Rhodothermaceae bacterium]